METVNSILPLFPKTYRSCVANTHLHLHLVGRGRGVYVWACAHNLIFYVVLWTMRMGYFAETFCSPLKTLIPSLLFCQFFWRIHPFNHAPTLILVDFFRPLVQSRHRPTNRPTSPSVSGGECEVREEHMVAAKRGASMPWVASTLLPIVGQILLV